MNQLSDDGLLLKGKAELRQAEEAFQQVAQFERWFAEAWLIASIGSRCTLERGLYREMRAVPTSTT